MPSRQFITDTRTFAKKGDAHEVFRVMLNKYDPGHRLTETDSIDLMALLKHHTEYSAKIGVGVSYLAVMRNQFNTQSFQIVRIDGSTDDFSYKHCITPKKN